MAHVEVGTGPLAARLEAVSGIEAYVIKSKPSLAFSMECAQAVTAR
jgi:hypothetical protein